MNELKNSENKVLRRSKHFFDNSKWADTGVCPYRANSKLSACSDSAVHIANEMKMLNPDIFPRDIIIVRELEIRPYSDFRTFGFITLLAKTFFPCDLRPGKFCDI